jgi:hypothetical protein
MHSVTQDRDPKQRLVVVERTQIIIIALCASADENLGRVGCCVCETVSVSSVYIVVYSNSESTYISY